MAALTETHPAGDRAWGSFEQQRGPALSPAAS